jgi:hypothetical protein
MDEERARSDRVLPTSRILGAAIVPFLVVAFLVLYPRPTDTQDWFAWTIRPTMTPMVLGSAYLGGAWFFVRVVRADRWHTVRIGFIPVTVFASCLGLATIIHWDKFNHGHVAFWLWAGLYFTTPFLVLGAYLWNQTTSPPASPDELRVTTVARSLMAATGIAAVGLGAYLYLVPVRAITIWPWALTPLTARVMGAVLLLGIAGILAAIDARWSSCTVMIDVARIMIALILVAAVRAHDEFDTSRPLTWLLGIGLTAVLIGATALDLSMRHRASGAAPREPAADAVGRYRLSTRPETTDP